MKEIQEKTRSNIKNVNVQKVLVIEEVIGDGSSQNPLNIVKHYFDIAGNHLFTLDLLSASNRSNST